MWNYHGAGPPQVWQAQIGNWVGDCSPLIRLYRAGSKGLPVGPGTRWLGGIRTDTAELYESSELIYVDRDSEGRIVRAYACQYSFDF